MRLFVRSFARSVGRSFVRSVSRSFGRSFVRLLACSLVHAFLSLFVRLCARLFVVQRSCQRGNPSTVLSLMGALFVFFGAYLDMPVGKRHSQRKERDSSVEQLATTITQQVVQDFLLFLDPFLESLASLSLSLCESLQDHHSLFGILLRNP